MSKSKQPSDVSALLKARLCTWLIVVFHVISFKVTEQVNDLLKGKVAILGSLNKKIMKITQDM
jgi:hypothetical protein